ncbi:hypothetical protein ISS37_02360 [candidate division KSB1 bacterium]|nr:hypothetical protein [candidate division KSB1 bacterium]
MKELWVPIVAIVMSFGAPLVTIVLALYYGFRKRRLLSEERISAIEKGVSIHSLTASSSRRMLRHAAIMLAIEKGMSVPPLPEEPPRSRIPLAWGLIFTGLGVGTFIALWVAVGIRVGVWGVIPFLIGIALLIFTRILADQEGAIKREKESQGEAQ